MNRMSHCIIAPVLLGAMLTLAGCQDTVNTATNTEQSMQPENVLYKYVTTDSFCRDRLKVVRIDRAETPSGLLQVQVTVRSERYGFWSELWSWITDENPYHISYKFNWLDHQGMAVKTVSGVWLPEIFIPGETKYLQAVAPTPQCKDFVVSFKESE